MVALTHNQLVIRHQPLPVALWSAHSPEAAQTAAPVVRLVQLSDLHFYEFTDPAYYARVVAHVAALRPDIIVITGDLVHYGSRYIPAAQAFLDALPAAIPILAVLGNHDYADGSHSRAIRAMLARTRVALLVNEARLLTLGSHRLWVAGVDDHKHGQPDLARTLAQTDGCSDAPILLLSHNPRQFDRLGPQPQATRVMFTLCGHTHAGHVFLPLLTPVYRFVLKMKYRHGFYTRAGHTIYVSAGLGGAAYYLNLPGLRTGFPRFRYNTYPEIAVFSLMATG